MADDRGSAEYRFTGPDADGMIWLEKRQADGGFALINLECDDEQGLLEAMALFLGEREYQAEGGGASRRHSGD